MTPLTVEGTNNMTILKFRESLVRSLLLGMPFEELKPGPRQKSTSQIKRKLADRKLKEKKDLHAMSQDGVLVAMSSSDNNNQEKQMRRQQRE